MGKRWLRKKKMARSYTRRGYWTITFPLFWVMARWERKFRSVK